MLALDDLGVTETRHAREWHGTVTLDGVDVSMRCAGVHYRGADPVAVRLYELDATGRKVWLPGRRAIATRLHGGVITATLVRRSAESPA